jgi:hypothetical protein
MSVTPPTSTSTATILRRIRFWFKLSAGVATPLIGFGLQTCGSLPMLQLPSARTPTPDTRHAQQSDDQLALHVRQAIESHPRLQPYNLNLRVNVLNGKAIISGPVPADGLRRSVEDVAAAVPGIHQCDVTLWVTAGSRTDPFTHMVGDRTFTKAAAGKPNTITDPPPVVLSVPSVGEAAFVEPPKAGRGANPDPSGLLLDPVAPPTTAQRPNGRTIPGAEPPSYPTIPPTSLPTVPVVEPANKRADSLPAATDGLRRNPRFAGLTVEVVDGVAVIGGRVSRHEDAWAFADELRKLPTVSRVAVGTVTIR